jgi:PleD family two-component response regulator
MTAKVMIVDDLDDNRNLLKMILEHDYSLCEASTGLECLMSINDEKPDLILLDVYMPGLSGYEVCKRIKMNPATAMIPVIFMSSTRSSRDHLTGSEAGGDEHIARPINEDILIEKIKTTLDRKTRHKISHGEAI